MPLMLLGVAVRLGLRLDKEYVHRTVTLLLLLLLAVVVAVEALIMAIPNRERCNHESSRGSGMATAVADGNDLPGTSAVVSRGSVGNDGRREQTLTGK